MNKETEEIQNFKDQMKKQVKFKSIWAFIYYESSQVIYNFFQSLQDYDKKVTSWAGSATLEDTSWAR